MLNFNFSENKHPNITLINKTTAHSATGQNGYKFAILDPSVQSSGNQKKKWAFKF